MKFGKNNTFNVVLTDYDLSREISELDWGATKFIGINYVMAPEIEYEQSYTNKVDLWSLGINIYYMYYGEYPFKNKKMYDEGKISKLPDDPVLRDLLSKLIVINPNDRIGWDEYLSHEFFDNVDFNFINEISDNDFDSDKNSTDKWVI